MLSKPFCFLLAGLLVVVATLSNMMSYGISADGRLTSHKTLIGMGFSFAVGVFWLYEDVKDLLRTHRARSRVSRPAPHRHDRRRRLRLAGNDIS